MFSKLDLTGYDDWTQDQCDMMDAVIERYHHIFAVEDLDLGRTDLVKKEIKLTNYVRFKERYRRIPPHQYEEVRKHLDEMLRIGAIRRSNSLWASAVVLLHKKDGALRFCIDLRILNERMALVSSHQSTLNLAIGRWNWTKKVFHLQHS